MCSQPYAHKLKKESVVPKTKIRFSRYEIYGEKTIVSLESDTSSLQSRESVDSNDSESCQSRGGHNAKSPAPTTPSIHTTSSTTSATEQRSEKGCCPTHHPQASEMEIVPSPTQQHPQLSQTLKKGSYQFVPESHTVVKAWHERYKIESCKLQQVKKINRQLLPWHQKGAPPLRRCVRNSSNFFPRQASDSWVSFPCWCAGQRRA